MSIEEENKKITNKAQESRNQQVIAIDMINDLLKVIRLMSQAQSAQTYATLLAIENGAHEEMKKKIAKAKELNEEAEKIMQDLLPKILLTKTKTI